MDSRRSYHSGRLDRPPHSAVADCLVAVLVLGLFFALAWGSHQMITPYHLGEVLPISLEPSQLPLYALRTVLRMFTALGLSLLATFVFGTWAAKNTTAESLIIPAVDVLQSVPVLSFLSMTVVGFIHLFPNSLLGPECACIFATFTAQVWNMILSFYQSLKTLPDDLVEVGMMFQLSGWQRFWKIGVPCAMPGLLWNMMMSMSASWFFVVLSEAIFISHQQIVLPGIGSYIAMAITQANLHAVLYAIVTMLLVIFIYDQLLFRPLISWSEKFSKDDLLAERKTNSWFLDLLRRSALLNVLNEKIHDVGVSLVNGIRVSYHSDAMASTTQLKTRARHFAIFIIALLVLWAGYGLATFIISALSFFEVLHVCLLGCITCARVVIMIALSSLVWVPIGVLIGRKPKLTKLAQPIIQFCAAFPANLIYPVVVMLVLHFKLNIQIWLTPLMILGAQWYILFNVIAGASRIPRELYLAASNFEVKGWLWWRRLALPGTFPFYVTGAMTAAGGAWNASIVTEWVSWGDTTLVATGLGSYIQQATRNGNFPGVALGTVVMCLFVLAFNHFLWRPLYRMAETRFSLN